MINLPEWRLTNKYPAFYDSESGSAIEQTAKVYAAMQELIKEYNQFVKDTNTAIDDFINTTNQDQETFATALRQEFQDFIDTVDMKIENIGGIDAADTEAREAIAQVAEQVTSLSEEVQTLRTVVDALVTAYEQLAEKYEIVEKSAVLVSEVEIQTTV